jgi:hypothetical protein
VSEVVGADSSAAPDYLNCGAIPFRPLPMELTTGDLCVADLLSLSPPKLHWNNAAAP